MQSSRNAIEVELVSVLAQTSEQPDFAPVRYRPETAAAGRGAAGGIAAAVLAGVALLALLAA